MKLPSLDTAEGIVVLGIGVIVAYAAYRAYKVGAGIADSVSDTLHSAVTSVEDAGKAILDTAGAVKDTVLDPSAASQSQSNMIAVGDTGIDGIPSWSLGGDSRIGADSQVPSPDAMGSRDAIDIPGGTLF